MDPIISNRLALEVMQTYREDRRLDKRRKAKGKENLTSQATNQVKNTTMLK